MAALAVWCTAFSNSHYQVHNDPYVWRVTEWDTHKQTRRVILIKPHSWYIWSKVRILFKDISPRCAERGVEIQDSRRSLGGVTTTWQLIATWEWELAAVDVRPALPFQRSEKLPRWQTDRQLWRQTDMWSREMEPEVVYLPLLQVSNSVWSSPFSAMGFVKSCQIVPSLFFWVVRTRRL